MRRLRGRRAAPVNAEEVEWLVERSTRLPSSWFRTEQQAPFIQGVAGALGLPPPARALGLGRAGLEASLRALAQVARREWLREPSPILQGYEGALGLSEPALDEGITWAFTALIASREVLTERLLLTPRDAERAAASERTRALFELRRRVVWASLEERALQNPQQELVRACDDLHQRVLGVQGMTLWTEHPNLLRAPLHSQCEALGAFVGAQLAPWLLAGANPQTSPAEAPLGAPLPARGGEAQAALHALRERVFSPGMRQSTDEKLLKLTGRRLEVEPLLDWLRPRRAALAPSVSLD